MNLCAPDITELPLGAKIMGCGSDFAHQAEAQSTRALASLVWLSEPEARTRLAVIGTPALDQ
jgi:hypothetical protein